jgi:hypothetical protein
VVAGGAGPGPLSVDVGEYQEILCTVRNIRLATIVVEKQTAPDRDPARFGFDGDLRGSLADGQTLTVALPGPTPT